MRSVGVFSLLTALSAPAHAAPTISRESDLDEKLGQPIRTDVELTDQNGHRVRLAEYFNDGKPVIVVLAYFRCNMLCDLVLRGLADGLREAERVPGSDFRVLTVSFDASDTAPEAARKQRTLLQAIGHPEAAAGWPFLVGAEPAIQTLADDLGFRYAYDPQTKQFAHPAAIFLLDPRARITRYLYGFQFPARDLRLAIAEAGQGRVGSLADRILLTCYRYDPATRRYGMVVTGIIRGGALAVLVFVGGGLGLLWRRDKRRAP